MRTIKFRVWDNKKKKMGQEFSLEDASYEGFPPPFVDANGECDLKADYVVMQSTNLLDKNGKEIYEGDLVLRDGRDASDLDQVEYGNSGFAPFAFYEFGDEGYDAKTCEVIGNVYENPDLIRGENNS